MLRRDVWNSAGCLWWCLWLVVLREVPSSTAQQSNVPTVEPDSPKDGWSYDQVNNWSTLFPEQCSGLDQSPININTRYTVPQLFEPFTFHDYDVFPPIETISDNGHTLVAEQNDAIVATVRGGGLSSEYRLKQFHFHWGSTNNQGSEHTINGARYPMELHLVHYNTQYGDVASSTSHHDGLMVLAVLFQISPFDNPALGPLMIEAANLTTTNGPHIVTHQPPFRSLLPANTKHFYRYSGSLTTPRCNEAVTWTIFMQPVGVSIAQLNVLRHLKDSHGNDLHDNFRPTQRVNGRRVCRSFFTLDELPTWFPWWW